MPAAVVAAMAPVVAVVAMMVPDLVLGKSGAGDDRDGHDHIDRDFRDRMQRLAAAEQQDQTKQRNLGTAHAPIVARAGRRFVKTGQGCFTENSVMVFSAPINLFPAVKTPSVTPSWCDPLARCSSE